MEQQQQFTVSTKQALEVIQEAIDKSGASVQAKPVTILRENIRSIKHNHPLTRRQNYPRLSYRRIANQIFYNPQELNDWLVRLIAAHSIVEGVIAGCN